MNIDKINALRNKVDIFFDFEASGLHPESYPIEIGIIHGDIKYQKYIKPVYHWDYWNNDAQAIHNITRETLFKEGFDIINVANELNEMFSGQTLWSDANEDRFWMDVLFQEAGIERHFNVANIRNIIPEQYQKLFSEETANMTEHRALSDAIELKRAWILFLDKLKDL
jgi:hypothetical protein